MFCLLLLVACAPEPVALHLPPGDGETIAMPSGNADWYVDAFGAGDFTTIQDAIDSAKPGDWILVNPATYQESIDFGGKSLVITSREGSENTILDGVNDAYTVVAQHGETVEMAGFTVTGGRSAAVYVDFSSLHLEDVELSGIDASYVINAAAADLELTRVTVENNRESYSTISMDRGSLQVNDSRITCGRSGYGIYQGHGYMQVDRSVLTCNRGYPVYSVHTTGTLIRSILTGTVYVENEDDHDTDSISLRNSVLLGNYQAIYGTLDIRNSLVNGAVSFTQFAETPGVPWIENSIFIGANCTISSDAPAMTVRNNSFWKTVPSCSGVELGGIDGNLTSDPMLKDFAGGDYHLLGGSPLVDAGVDEDAYDDIDGSRNDIGIFGGHFSMDGGW